MNKSKTKVIAISALFTSIITATAWISVPTPFYVNLTFQTFGVCLTAFVLGTKKGISTVVAYIAIGAVGLPVFSSFTGGIGILFGASGGFLFGFLPCAVLCGTAIKVTQRPIKYLLMLFAVLTCHIIGVIQFSLVLGVNVWMAFITASLPFLLKDLIFIFIADFTANKIKNKIKM